MRRTRRLFVALVCIASGGAMALVVMLVASSRSAPQLTVNYLGRTNFFQDITYIRNAKVINLSNASSVPLQVALLPELKQTDWPIYGPTNPYIHRLFCFLPPGQATNVIVQHAPYPGVWRVRVDYCEALTNWEIQRYGWARSLKKRKLDWLARVAAPAPRMSQVVTPEMNE
jgi:hypothetical protein